MMLYFVSVWLYNVGNIIHTVVGASARARVYLFNRYSIRIKYIYNNKTTNPVHILLGTFLVEQGAVLKKKL